MTIKDWVLIAAFLAFACAPALAADGEGVLTGSVDLTFRTFGNANDSAKFQEYRDMSGGILGGLSIGYRKGRNHFRLDGLNLGLDDQRVSIVGGNFARFKVEFDYNQIPHRFALDTPSIWGGFGTNYLTLPDAIQSAAQAAPSTPTSARESAVQSALSQYMANATLQDWELERKRVQAALEVQSGEPLTFRMELSREDRDGTSPFFGAFGEGGTVQAYELPEPVHYTTDSARLSAEYARANQYLKIGYYTQAFDNESNFLRFDNPLSLVDNPASSPYPIAGALIPGMGQMSLPPSNRFHNIVATGSISRLPWDGRLTATVSSGRMRQDETLLPATINSAFGPITQPATTADARVDTMLYRIAFMANPTDRLDLRAAYNSYEYDNKTPVRTWQGVVLDTGGPDDLINVPTSYRNRRTELDLGYEFSDAIRAGIGYASRDVRRTNREVADEDESVWNAHVNSRLAEWLTLRGSYEHSKRSGAYDYTVPFVAGGIAPDNWDQLRKFDEAARKHDSYTLQAVALPGENAAVTATVGYNKDRYHESVGGLLSDKSWLFSLDADYSLRNGGSLFAFASYEKFSDFQQAWQWNPGDSFATREPAQWTADSKMRVTTLGMGFDLPLRPRKLDLLVNFTQSLSNGGIVFFSPLGTSANDRNLFTPLPFSSVEDSKLTRLDAQIRYAVDTRITASLGWTYERFTYSDFQLDGFSSIPVQTSNGTWRTTLGAGTLWRPYSVNLFYGKVGFKF